MASHGHLFFTILSIALMGTVSSGSSGLRYWVGDSVWSIPPYPNYYADWSSSHFFRTGDSLGTRFYTNYTVVGLRYQKSFWESLVFNFETEFYDLMQVPILDYQSCTANSPIKVLKAGPAIIQLNEPGVFYFLCNLSNFCSLGQKISIIVHDKSFAPAPVPAPSSVLSTPPPAPFLSPEPSPGKLNVSQCPGPVSSGEAPSPADLYLNKGSCGRSSSALIGLGSSCWLLLCYLLSVFG